jgi:hypothetical protein
MTITSPNDFDGCSSNGIGTGPERQATQDPHKFQTAANNRRIDMRYTRNLPKGTYGSAVLTLAGTILLSGCALNGGAGSSTSVAPIVAGATTHSGGIGGIVHGGQQAVNGATVILWAAGTSGTYGTGATNLGSTTTASDGSFSLDVATPVAISAYNVASNVATFTTAANNMAVGETVTLSGFGTSTFFNAQTVTVLSVTGTTFTANVAAIIPVGDAGAIAQTTEAGTVTYQGSPCTNGQYLYLTATGGSAGGGVNNSIGMMAAIPAACSSATANTTVWIDEVTTVAAVTALQQFMSINTSATAPYTGTGTVPWKIGAPSTNTTGMANAFLQTANLAFITTGVTGESFPSNTVGGLLYTTTINPDSQKINGLADILATCVNDTTGNLCTGSADVLTMTTIANGATSPTYTIPQDTIQAAYNMATLPNPALYSGAKYWKNSSSSATYLSTLWPNINATPPFQPYLSATPNDTTIGVQWRTENPSNNTVGTVYAESVAIDGKGYVWTGGGSSTITTNLVNQFNPSGQLQQTISTAAIPSYTLSYYADTTTATTGTTTANASYALGYARPHSLAIDTNNNAWFDAYGGASPGTVAGLLSGVTVQISQSGTASGYLTGSNPGAIVIDGSNNLFMGSIPTSGKYYFSGLPSSTSYQSVYEGIGRGSSIYNGLAIDSTGYVWGFSSSSTCTNFSIPRINNALMQTTTGTSTGTVTMPSNCIYNGAGDANGNMWGTDGTNLYYINIASSLSSPTVTTSFTGGSTTGLYATGGMAVDGSGNVWVANKGVVNTAAGVAEFATSGTTGTVTQLSPSGTSIYGFGSDSGFSVGSGGPVSVVLDSSGNVWFETSAGSYLYYIVGAASPIKTPLAAMYGSIGTKP